MAALGLYLHIPFCVSKCPYCDFNSYGVGVGQVRNLPPPETARVSTYLEALARELELRSKEARGEESGSVFFGGGTPSLLRAEQLGAVLESVRRQFHIKAGAEVTLEANPGTVTPEKLRRLREAGFNRVSLGVQSFSERLLQTLGRAHTAREGREAMAAAREAGFENLNLDLIFAIPGQSQREWEETLEEALKVRPEHISAYCLTVEEGTRFAELMQRGELEGVGEEEQLEMWELACRLLERTGYRQYEISNFARPAYECQHNLIYWRNESYLGLGAGAHSYLEGIRWRNVSSPEEYGRLLGQGRLPVRGAERLSRQREMGETIALGLRLSEGIGGREFARRFGISLEEAYGSVPARLEAEGLVRRDGRGLRLTPRGRRVANEVCLQFIG